MKKEEIAQWVIDNRYSKSEKEKVSDFEMYNLLIEKIEALSICEVTKPLSDSLKIGDNVIYKPKKKAKIILECINNVVEIQFNSGSLFVDRNELELVPKSI